MAAVHQPEIITREIDITALADTGATTAIVIGNDDILICGVCHRQWNDVSDYLAHRAEHPTATGVHRCELCKKTFSHIAVLLDHYKSKHRVPVILEEPQLVPNNGIVVNQPIESQMKDERNNVAEVLQEPTQEQKGDFNFVLITETIKGSTFEYGKIAFKCLYCDFKGFSKSAIVLHMQDRHQDVLNGDQNVQPKEVVNSKNAKVTSLSAYNQSSKESTKRTKKSRRRRTGGPKPNAEGQFPCVKCNKMFHRSRSLRIHLETHRTERNFLCDTCGKAFKSRTRLTVHRKVHKEKIFKCIQCDFTSTVNAAIHAHRQVHSQGSVLCDICGSAYTDKSTLNKHMRVHSRDRPYACTIQGCTWRFKSETMCKAHIRGHTTQGRFKCSVCGYVFRHKHHLQRHETKMHGVQLSKSRPQPRHEKQTITTQVVQPDLTLPPLPGHLQQVVVATDSQGNALTYEAADLSALNISYQTLISSQDTRTIFTTSAHDPQNLYGQ
ncbi:zinc finger protein 660-like [Branchiostoma floridae]|uniref:Zinc finger protein 660-like n=1 Tax=Branchiostoma floridae TaxID=7739 RepID=A0A9J7LCH1_BRAFL|nr:zinc finger protein 660-like [Branchiostoma floridae]